jgi:hypothetical protein
MDSLSATSFLVYCYCCDIQTANDLGPMIGLTFVWWAWAEAHAASLSYRGEPATATTIAVQMVERALAGLAVDHVDEGSIPTAMQRQQADVLATLTPTLS